MKARGTLQEGERDRDVREAAPPSPPWPVSWSTWSGHCQQESKPDASKNGACLATAFVLCLAGRQAQAGLIRHR